MKEADFDAVVRQGVELQQRFPGGQLVAVGGTAASLHCGHRFSLDVDCVTPQLRERYDEFAEGLEAWPGWQTKRKNPPVLLLGERNRVDLGLRQLRRATPLRSACVRGLVVSTLAETLRIKAFLLGERRATRDYVDFCALAEKAGAEPTLAALDSLNLLYPRKDGLTTVSRFAESCEALPADFSAVDLQDYKGLTSPFNDWDFVSRVCRETGHRLLKRELAGMLPKTLSTHFE